MPPKVFRGSKKGPRAFFGKPLAANHFTVDSISALEDYLKFRPKQVKELVCKQTYLKTLQAVVPRGMPIAVLPDDEFERGSFLARIEIQAQGENSFYEKIASADQRIILALDHLKDPQNLGAIARTAAFFGVSEIIAPKDRQVLLTQSSLDTSQGAFSLCDFYVVTNLVRSLSKLKDMGYWVVGTDMDGEDIASLKESPRKTVLVLGSEEKGLSSLVEKSCDFKYAIHGKKPSLNSLNVSVATGIIIQNLFAKRI